MCSVVDVRSLFQLIGLKSREPTAPHYFSLCAPHFFMAAGSVDLKLVLLGLENVFGFLAYLLDVGHKNVGKTCIFDRYVYDKFGRCTSTSFSALTHFVSEHL